MQTFHAHRTQLDRRPLGWIDLGRFEEIPLARFTVQNAGDVFPTHARLIVQTRQLAEGRHRALRRPLDVRTDWTKVQY